MKIVWIEDEEGLLRECSDFLRKESIEVYGASTWDEADNLIASVLPDLLLVDWMLPGGISGIDICKWNEKRWKLPFIMVTAKGDEFDKVLALELGADDYLTKPFGLRELSARIKAVMRRAGKLDGNMQQASHDSVIRRGRLELDQLRFMAMLDGQKLELTRTEFLLLWKLASNPGRVFTRTHLMDEALGDGFLGYERTLDSHIRNLRRKLEVYEEGVALIQTVYGVGYRFAEGV
ncbi:DNA-binding response OmpR family regulator [Paenibacillus castaneae]|uniref:winged helix-turn-helix domain-containing protein n=1 Tax=Paenibacillus castaneae TaxID=474957 RepID=UPI000C9AF279|nr:response regulator transcription factor [Paenibacillus castaneae]NIK77886.1 DNA-binding response OmpR family regulator [Paenibacillus castaneae]